MALPCTRILSSSLIVTVALECCDMRNRLILIIPVSQEDFPFLIPVQQLLSTLSYLSVAWSVLDCVNMGCSPTWIQDCNSWEVGDLIQGECIILRVSFNRKTRAIQGLLYFSCFWKAKMKLCDTKCHVFPVVAVPDRKESSSLFWLSPILQFFMRKLC